MSQSQCHTRLDDTASQDQDSYWSCEKTLSDVILNWVPQFLRRFQAGAFSCHGGILMTFFPPCSLTMLPGNAFCVILSFQRRKYQDSISYARSVLGEMPVLEQVKVSGGGRSGGLQISFQSDSWEDGEGRGLSMISFRLKCSFSNALCSW
jgi:hypothetical protein